MVTKAGGAVSCFVVLFVIGVSTNLFSNSLHKPQVYANGLFVKRNDAAIRDVKKSEYRKRESENGHFSCQYTYGSDGHINNLTFFNGDKLICRIRETNAHSVRISNRGYLLLTTIKHTPQYSLAFTFYSPQGNLIYAHSAVRPEVSHFSRQGDFFGVSSKDYLEVIDLNSTVIQKYRPGKKFAISDDGSVVAVAYERGISLYKSGALIRDIITSNIYNRDVAITSDNGHAATIDINTLSLYSIADGSLVYSDKLSANESFRELAIQDMTLYGAVKFEDHKTRKGILKTYELGKKGVLLHSTEVVNSEPLKTSGINMEAFNKKYRSSATDKEHQPIPWPFKPQDQPHQMWNNYEALNTSGDGVINTNYPYLHQGVDMEVNANQPCYSVDTGIVKYHGDKGGAGELYWRIAVPPTNVSGYSNGWLYAHLVERSINYDVGDRIRQTGVHVGDIIKWYGNVDAHIHFCNIRDHGNTWSFTDDEWGLTFNPEIVLTPNNDTSSPVIIQALNNKSKFAYCKNNEGYNTTSRDYFYPDSARGGLNGDIDISVNIYDYITYRNFTQPAYRIYYWIKGIDRINCWSNYNKLIVDTTLAQIRNHAYSRYNVPNYKKPSQVMYKADDVFIPGGWFNRTRKFAHVLTNNNGDSVLTNGELDSCLHTAKYFDGWYRVYVKAFDCKGNMVVDSEDVYFNNGNNDPTPISLNRTPENSTFFVSHTKISQSHAPIRFTYYIPTAANYSLVLYDLAGNRIKTLVDGVLKKGRYRVVWDGTAKSGERVSNGIYVYRFRGSTYNVSGKITYSQ